MKRFLVISDTHGVLPLSVDLMKVDGVFHAGDVGGIDILNMLSFFDLHFIVEGNTDKGTNLNLPFYITTEQCGIRIFVVHNLTAPHRIISENKRIIERFAPNVVIFGHTHLPFIKMQKDILFFNPGSIGKVGLTLKQSYGVLSLEEGEIVSAEIFELGKKVPFLKWER